MPQEIHWTDSEEIGIQLHAKFPDMDPLRVRLHRPAPICDRAGRLRRRPRPSPMNRSSRQSRWPGTTSISGRRLSALTVANLCQLLWPPLVPAEGVLEVHDLRLAARHQVHAHYIESHRRKFGLRQLPRVSSRQLAQDSPLVPIHRSLGRRHVARRARLHFHDAQQLSLPRDQVHVTGHIAPRPAPRHHRIPFAQQRKKCSVLAREAPSADAPAFVLSRVGAKSASSPASRRSSHPIAACFAPMANHSPLPRHHLAQIGYSRYKKEGPERSAPAASISSQMRVYA